MDVVAEISETQGPQSGPRIPTSERVGPSAVAVHNKRLPAGGTKGFHRSAAVLRSSITVAPVAFFTPTVVLCSDSSVKSIRTFKPTPDGRFEQLPSVEEFIRQTRAAAEQFRKASFKPKTDR